MAGVVRRADWSSYGVTIQRRIREKFFIFASLFILLLYLAAASQPPVPASRVALGHVISITPARVAKDITPSPKVGHVLTPSDLEPWLDGLLPSALARGDIAGAAVAVVRDGQIVLIKGYGYADAKDRRPVVAQTTLFRVGSISKLFTWTAVMQLVDQGTVDLDRDVNVYLDFKIPSRPGGPITLRQLMTHRSGFEEAYKGLIRTDRSDVEPLGLVLKRWIPKRIFAAGTTPAYSNYGAALAGYIVERQSGMPFDAYVERRILLPLHMNHSTFKQPVPARFSSQLSKGYFAASQGPQPFESISLAPAGGLSGTAADMAKFMLAHLGRTEANSSKLFGDRTAAMMHNWRAAGIGPLRRMRLGFYESDINGRQVIAHSGDTQEFHSDMNLFLNERTGIFVAMNSSGKDSAAYSLRASLLEEFANRYFPVNSTDPNRMDLAPPRLGNSFKGGNLDTAITKLHVSQITGSYESTRRAQSNFMAILGLFNQTIVQADDNGHLSVSGIDDLAGNPREWHETAPYLWEDETGSQRLAAEVRDGKVIRISADEIAPIMALDRIPWWLSATWLVPTLWASVSVLALVILAWPLGALKRRLYKQASTRTHYVGQALLWARLGAIAVLLSLAAWRATVLEMASNLNLMSPELDSWLWALSLTLLVALTAAAATALAYIWSSWRISSAWPDKFWSLALTLSIAAIGWIATCFKLLSFSTNY
ncbi:CubicO group peptidase (beta-lactamase class C family) [Sphingomonas sp. UYAg733]